MLGWKRRLKRASEKTKLRNYRAPLHSNAGDSRLRNGEGILSEQGKRSGRSKELDLGSHDPNKPKIGHHWARRKADQVARDSMDTTETVEETIDEAFGWNQKQAKRKQQLHYAGSTEILKLARVTLML